MAKILNLPLETLRHLIIYLAFRDLGALARSHWHLSSRLLGNPVYCRELVERFIPASEEATLAAHGVISYRKALTSCYQKQYSFLRGCPLHLTSLDPGEDFLYQNGTLCVLYASTVVVYDSCSSRGKRLNLAEILSPRVSMIETKNTLLAFASGVLSLRVDAEHTSVVVSVKLSEDGFIRKESHITSIRTSDRLVQVRNNERLVVVAPYRQNEDGGMAWQFYVSVLGNRNPGFSTRRLEVGQFTSPDIGIDLVFEIINNELWLLSSGVTINPEEPTSVSYYGGCRCRLQEPDVQPEFWRIWRRSHIEGPIDDTWTSLRLFKDDQANYVIAECRSEWVKSEGDVKSRSFYSTVFRPGDFKEAVSCTTHGLAVLCLSENAGTDEFDAIEEILAGVSDDRLTTFSGYRLRHAEPAVNMEGSPSKEKKRIYRASQTIMSFHNYSADAFVDLVIEGLVYSESNVVLCFGSRSPLGATEQQNAGPNEATLHFVADSEPPNGISMSPEHYSHPPVITFPSYAEQEFVRYKTKGIQGTRSFADERAIVFGPVGLGPAVKAKTGEGSKESYPLVIVSFDPLACWTELETFFESDRIAIQTEASGSTDGEYLTSLTLPDREENSGATAGAADEKDSLSAMGNGSQSNDSWQLDSMEDEMREAAAEARAGTEAQNHSIEEAASDSEPGEQEREGRVAQKRRFSSNESRHSINAQPGAGEGAHAAAGPSSSSAARSKKIRTDDNNMDSDDEDETTNDLILLSLGLRPNP